MSYRRRFGIGEIIPGPRGWRSSYWFVAEHAPDYVAPKGEKHHSRELLQHVPTGITGILNVTSLRRGHCPALSLNDKDKFQPICYSVRGHHSTINNPDASRHKTYKGMPFQKEWDPNHGGSFLRGAWEIYQDIGPRPSPTHQLSIVIHEKGFVRGNLCWSTRATNWLEAVLRRAKKSGETKEHVLALVEFVWDNGLGVAS
jgi:hypothetical protein